MREKMTSSMVLRRRNSLPLQDGRDRLWLDEWSIFEDAVLLTETLRARTDPTVLRSGGLLLVHHQ
jgi:hypothetical protein